MKNTSKCRRRTLPVSRPFSRPAIFIAGSLLLSAHPAFAQTLTVNSGSATVSGTGTAVVGSGTTFSGGASNATTNYTTGIATGEDTNGPSTLNLQAGASIQSITADFGGVANISGGTVGTAKAGKFGSINISEGTVTTASTGNDFGSLIISGGMVQTANSGVGVSSANNHFAISGGTIGSVYYGYAGVTIAGGMVGLVSRTGSYGAVNVSAGTIQDIEANYGLTMSGGTAKTVNAGSFGDNSSNSSFTDGTIQTLNLLGGDNNKVSGGTITSLDDRGANTNIKISGGSFQFITNHDSTNQINITGIELKETVIPNYDPGMQMNGFHLSGILTNGETLDATYAELKDAPPTLEFNGAAAVSTPVPEVSTLGSLSLLLLSGLSLALHARKRRTA